MTIADGSSTHAPGSITADLFGAFRLNEAERDLRPRSRKTAGLLAFLLSTDRGTVSRTRLANLLWSDRGEQQARNSLRQALFEMRASGLKDLVQVNRTEVSIVRACFTCDVDRIAMLARDGDCGAVAAVLSQIDGSFLDDLDGLSPAFDEWLLPERARQRERLFAAAIKCAAAAHAEATGEERALLSELERLDPLDEAVLRMRLQIDHAVGDIAAVHRRYRRLSDDLARELSAAPSRETQDLFRELVTRPSPSSRSPAAHIEQKQVAGDHRGPPLVAITPFEADGGDYSRFAATLADRIAGSLGRSTDLRVMLAHAVAADELPAILHRAVVSFALRGSIRRIGGSAALNIQLTNTRTGQLVWSDGWDVDVASLAEIEPLVERIAGAIGPATDRALSSETGSSEAGGIEEPSALYNQAKRLVREARTLDAVRAGMAMLERVIELDPRHVGARVRLAQLYNTDLHYLTAGHDVAEMRDRALRLALEAAELQPGTARVRLLLAWCRLRLRNWDVAGRLLHEVREQMPHDPDVMNECGFALAMMGELDAARALLQRAFRLNPFPPAEYHADMAVLLALAGEHEAAEAHFGLCGEQRLFWSTVRLCNLHRLGSPTPQMIALDSRLISSFRAIWTGPADPALVDLLAWGETIFCFRLSEHKRLIAEGLTEAWARQSQAGADSGS